MKSLYTTCQTLVRLAPAQLMLGGIAASLAMMGCQASPVEPVPASALTPATLTGAAPDGIRPGMMTPDNQPEAGVRSDRPRDARINGGLAVIPLPDSPDPASLRLSDRPVWTGRLPGLSGRYAVVGLDLGQGGTTLALRIPGAPVLIAAQQYPEQHLTLTQTQYVNPDPDQLARFEREAAEQKHAYRQFTPAAGPDASWPMFRWPLVGRLSSPFGLRRFFNEEPRAPHLGVDIAGTAGMIAVAPADGVVALTGDYFFNGRTVIIDHGQGLFSMLCHFRKVLVTPGQAVKAGDAVGEVGSTGRATAPHLHWTVSLNDARIDPHWLFPAGAGADDPARP